MIRPFGEAALLVDTGTAPRAQALAASLRASPLPGVTEAVPGLESLLVELDARRAEPTAVTDALRQRLERLDAPPPEGRLRVIRVVYDGPDLGDVAELTHLSVEEVVRRHAATELRVLFCGFAPGFAYLGDLTDELRVPRLATPRARTPAGSVAIAGPMSGVYPADLPGGWRLIGRTSVTLFDPSADPPSFLVPGDRVRFEPAPG